MRDYKNSKRIWKLYNQSTMAQRRNITPSVKTTAILSISHADFQNRISKQIALGEELFIRNIINDQEFDKFESDFKIWNDFNFELLKQVFNIQENDYMDSYNHAGYHMLGQMGEVSGNRVLTLKNLIEYKLNDLKSLLSRSELIKSEVSSSDNSDHGKKSVDFSITEVFIVHGHDDLAKTKAARFIEKLGLKPIILHEQTNAGKTIIEKIEEHSNVGFGIVLYTSCDMGCKKGDEANLKDRARQNVVFEHGFLIGKIGRKNVCALVKNEIEIPNDISGVVYIKMDEDEAWHLKVAKELRNSGYTIDLNKL